MCVVSSKVQSLIGQKWEFFVSGCSYVNPVVHREALQHVSVQFLPTSKEISDKGSSQRNAECAT